MKNKYNICFRVAFLIICIILTGCGNKSGSIYVTPGSNYTTIQTIDNLAFSVPSYIANQATAVTQISDDEDYASNSVYSYKNGKDEYLLFCMDELVIMSYKGTTFDFQNSENKIVCLENSGLLGTWFSSINKKKLIYDESIENEVYKIIADVSAEVVITTDLYGDYVGKLASIQYGQDEWSLFVGVAAENKKEMNDTQSEIVNTITSSMCLRENPVVEEPSYEVVIDGLDTITENSSAATDEQENVSEELSNESQIVDSTSESISVYEEENESITEETSEMESSEIPNEEDTINENTRKGMNLKNQKSSKKEIGKAYTSDEYSMLEVGQSGIMTAIDSSFNETQPIIRINKIYTGDEAIRLVKENAQNTDVYDYFSAPAGYSWHVAEYDVNYSTCSEYPYIDIKIEGLDGNALVFRGVSISERTHDANYRIEQKDDTVYGCMIYYAVPNGCHEYVLRCGEGSPEENDQRLAAYYHIKL